MFEPTLLLIAKIFPWIFSGWLLARFKARALEAFSRGLVIFALWGLVPLFIFLEMWGSRVGWALSGKIVGVAAAVLLLGSLGAYLLARSFARPFREICLPIIFMNSAYLAIPLNALFFGQAGVAYCIIYNVLVTLAHFSLGIFWVSGSLKEPFRNPILYAAFAGILLRASPWSPPEWAQNAYRFISEPAIKAMLIVVGYELSHARPQFAWQVFWGVLIRMGGGICLSWLLVETLSISGAARGVLILTSAMPSAVNTYILSKKYGADSAYAAAMIVAGLLLSLLVIPLALRL